LRAGRGGQKTAPQVDVLAGGGEGGDAAVVGGEGGAVVVGGGDVRGQQLTGGRRPDLSGHEEGRGRKN